MSVRIGIAGCGAIAEAMHLPAAVDQQDFKIVALVDPNTNRTSLLQTRFDIPLTAENLYQVADDLDAVIICTPPHMHLKAAEDAFSLGLHVLCEKPMANTVTECEQMISSAMKAKRVLAIAHHFRFYPSRQAVKQMIANEDLGKLKSVTVEQGNPYSWQTVSGYNMQRELVPGGVLIDAGIHPLDTLLWWCGDPVNIEYEDDAFGGLESNVRLRLEFKNNVKGFLRLSRTCRLPNLFKIESENEVISLFPYNPWQLEISHGNKIIKKNVTNQSITAADCARRQLVDFAESIIHGRSSFVTGEEGLRVIRLIEKCYNIKHARAMPEEAPIPGLTW